MGQSRARITKMPETAHVTALFASSVTSFVLTAQDFNATFFIIGNLIPRSPYRLYARIAWIFAPLGCLGFKRLPVSLYLSSDYRFMNHINGPAVPSIIEIAFGRVVSDNVLQAYISSHHINETAHNRLIPPHYWQGILYRMF